MSTQRRRVLEDSKLIIPADGVYIEGLDRKVYTVDNWKGGTAANSVVVASGDVKFRVALDEPWSTMSLCDEYYYPFGNYMTAIPSKENAVLDFDGVGNTEKIIKVEPSTNYAAGYCNRFTFPDGKTKGYIPSLGQWNLVYQNRAAVDAALSACGGMAIRIYNAPYYWSSTLEQSSVYNSSCWIIQWNAGIVGSFEVSSGCYVRPFADIS